MCMCMCMCVSVCVCGACVWCVCIDICSNILNIIQLKTYNQNIIIIIYIFVKLFGMGGSYYDQSKCKY